MLYVDGHTCAGQAWKHPAAKAPSKEHRSAGHCTAAKGRRQGEAAAAAAARSHSQALPAAVDLPQHQCGRLAFWSVAEASSLHLEHLGLSQQSSGTPEAKHMYLAHPKLQPPHSNHAFVECNTIC